VKQLTCAQHEGINASVLGLCDLVLERGIEALKRETNGMHRDILKSPALAAYIDGFFAMVVHATTEDNS